MLATVAIAILIAVVSNSRLICVRYISQFHGQLAVGICPLAVLALPIFLGCRLCASSVCSNVVICRSVLILDCGTGRIVGETSPHHLIGFAIYKQIFSSINLMLRTNDRIDVSIISQILSPFCFARSILLEQIGNNTAFQLSFSKSCCVIF